MKLSTTMAKDKHRQARLGLAKVETSTGQRAVKRLSGLHPVVKKDLLARERNEAKWVSGCRCLSISGRDIAELAVLLGRLRVA
jgi:hypothetical protein